MNYFIKLSVIVLVVLFFFSLHSVSAQVINLGCDPTVSNCSSDIIDLGQQPCDPTKESCGVSNVQAPTQTPTQPTSDARTPSGYQALAPIPGLTDISPTSVINSATLATFFNNFYKYLIGIAAILAIIYIIWGGLEMAWNQDNVSTLIASKGKIYNALYGLLIVLAPALVFTIINPSILNLKLDLPELKTSQSANLNGSANEITNVPPPDSGCITAQGGTYIERFVCATNQDTQDLTKYPCPVNLNTRTNIACPNWNPNTKVCASGYQYYCSGKSITVVQYQAQVKRYFGMTGPSGDKKIIDRDVQTNADFIAGCKSDGGKVTEIALDEVISCPLDNTYPSYNTSTQVGWVCYNDIKSCDPP